MIDIIWLREGDGEEVYAPVLLCDVCGKRCDKDSRLAFAAESVLHERLARIRWEGPEVMTVHKGECGRVADARLRQAGYRAVWQDIADFLRFVTKNTLDP